MATSESRAQNIANEVSGLNFKLKNKIMILPRRIEDKFNLKTDCPITYVVDHIIRIYFKELYFD